MGRRPRGESDLGGPAGPHVHTRSIGCAFSPVRESTSDERTSSSTQEILTALLIPLPFLLATLAFPPRQRSSNAHAGQSPIIQACVLASGSLLLVGLLAKGQSSLQTLDRRKASFPESRSNDKAGSLSSAASLQPVLARCLSVGLPFYAALQLGEIRIALTLLVTVAAGLAGHNLRGKKGSGFGALTYRAKDNVAACVALACGVLIDFSGFAASSTIWDRILGYIALALAILYFPLPLPSTSSSFTPSTSHPASLTPVSPWATPRKGGTSFSAAASPITATSHDINLTIVAGSLLGGLAVLLSVIFSVAPPVSYPSLLYSSFCMASTVGLLSFTRPSLLRSQGRLGLAVGCLMIGAFSLTYHSRHWAIPLFHISLCAVSYGASLSDSKGQADRSDDHARRHDSHDHAHHGSHSRLTGFLLSRTSPGSIFHSVLSEKDSRRIAYFGVLNLCFMMVQFFYGFASGSLGLLTDSIHMLFDCAGLAVGLVAAVMSKWPPSVNFPYGYGKVDSLSGFANGVFLILVSVEIVFDAVGRLREGHELRRLNELLIVSILGFLVNIVGLLAFGHAHHGHGHDHGHDHGHSHGHSHAHEEKKDNHEQARDPSPQRSGHLSPTKTKFNFISDPLPESTLQATSDHSHENENMHGIFLHILADAMGSVSVILSTILTKWSGWSGWDPLASCVISVLIFASAIPLVKSSGRRLLLTIPDKVEWKIREALGSLGTVPGVRGYRGCRFWLEDEASSDGHGHHHHGHDHGHGHGHGRGHDHGHHHNYSHGHDQDGHNHADSHSHNHDHDHHHHSHDHDHGGKKEQKVLGVIHIIATRTADVEDVRARSCRFLEGRGMDVVVHVEREGEENCWCAGTR